MCIPSTGYIHHGYRGSPTFVGTPGFAYPSRRHLSISSSCEVIAIAATEPDLLGRSGAASDDGQRLVYLGIGVVEIVTPSPGIPSRGIPCYPAGVMGFGSLTSTQRNLRLRTPQVFGVPD